MAIQVNGTDVQEFSVNGNPVTQVSANGTVVWEDAYFDIQNFSAPSTVTEGDSFTVSADVVNTGDGRDTQSISFNRGGSQSEQLDGGQSTTVSFTETINSTGDYTVSISSADDSASSTVTVESSGPTAQTYTYDSNNEEQRIDVSSYTGTYYVEAYGAGGQDGANNNTSGGAGGNGGYVEVEVDFSNMDQVDIGPGTSNGDSWECDGGMANAHGGGLTTVDFNPTTATRLEFSAHGGGGGGAGDNGREKIQAAGGSGAGGGGIGANSSGEDAECSSNNSNAKFGARGGYGGEGADSGENGDPGGDGGTHIRNNYYNDNFVTRTDGGGGSGDGKVVLFARQ